MSGAKGSHAISQEKISELHTHSCSPETELASLVANASTKDGLILLRDYIQVRGYHTTIGMCTCTYFQYGCWNIGILLMLA